MCGVQKTTAGIDDGQMAGYTATRGRARFLLGSEQSLRNHGFLLSVQNRDQLLSRVKSAIETPISTTISRHANTSELESAASIALEKALDRGSDTPLLFAEVSDQSLKQYVNRMIRNRLADQIRLGSSGSGHRLKTETDLGEDYSLSVDTLSSWEKFRRWSSSGAFVEHLHKLGITTQDQLLKFASERIHECTSEGWHRDLAELILFEGCSVSEAADRLGYEIDTVRKACSRLIRKLEHSRQVCDD